MREFPTKYFSEQLKHIRKKYGGNIGIAKIMGIKVEQINNYTKGDPVNPTLEFLYNLLSELGEDLNLLLTGEGLINTYILFNISIIL